MGDTPDCRRRRIAAWRCPEPVPSRVAGDFEYDEVHRDDDGPSVPGSVPGSPAAQGSPVGPPD